MVKGPLYIGCQGLSWIVIDLSTIRILIKGITTMSHKELALGTIVSAYKHRRAPKGNSNKGHICTTRNLWGNLRNLKVTLM